MKGIFSSWTMWVSAAQVLAGLLNNLGGAGVIDPQAGWAVVLAGVLQAALRLKTNTGVKLPGSLIE